jgi:hypothetical protein
MNRHQRRALVKINRFPKPKVIDLRDSHIQISQGSNTGILEERCYANIFQSCDGGISREHFISHNILRQLQGVSPKGIPWLKHIQDEYIATDSLVTKCLCNKHNSSLSPLDTLAGKAFEVFKRYGQNQAERLIVPGELFERWCLKFLFGVLATKQIKYKSKVYLPVDLDPRWLKVLFGMETMPAGCGLHIRPKLNQRIDFRDSIGMDFVYLEEKLVGFKLNFAGLDFYFLLITMEKAFNMRHKENQYVMYRPKSINKHPYPQELNFLWDS